MKSVFPRFLCLLVMLLESLPAQGLQYLEYDKDLVAGPVYKARREKLNAEIGKDAIAVFYSAPERTRNADVGYQYRQDDNFYYLTGYPESHAVLVLVPGGYAVRDAADTSKTVTVTEILFVEARNPTREHWNGRMYGPEGAIKLRGLQHAMAIDKFSSMLTSIIFSSGAKSIYLPPLPSDLSGEIAETMGPLRLIAERIRNFHLPIEMRDPTPAVFRMRAVKSPEEIAMIAKATEISALAHRQAMMSCEPGMYEYELQGVYEYVYRKKGAEYSAYPCIVGAAENSVILHYNTVRRQIKDGDLVLADCGAEYHGYATDITRTFPANGKFSPAQRRIYEIVLAAQNAVIEMLKPGVAWSDVSAKAAQVVEEGLLKLGLIKEKNGREYRKFFTHGLGHPVGLNVHDVPKPVMETGMVYTVEPGIYIQEGTEGIGKEYANIGVRIEDTILVTADGHRNLSSAAPREIEEIEKLMKKKGIGNQVLE